MTQDLSERGYPLGYRVRDANGRLGERWTMLEGLPGTLSPGQTVETCEVVPVEELTVDDVVYLSPLARAAMRVLHPWVPLDTLDPDGNVTPNTDTPAGGVRNGMLTVSAPDGTVHRLTVRAQRQLLAPTRERDPDTR